MLTSCVHRGRKVVQGGRSGRVRGRQYQLDGHVPTPVSNNFQLNSVQQGTEREKRTVLSLNSFFSVGTFFHGNHPHPVNFPPGV